MTIIGLDSSGLTASVAIARDDTVVAEYSVNYKKTHSQTLVPMLDEITKMTELDLSTVDAVAISKGPGSFTGLRIGSATAKGLGAALNVPIVEIPTTEALAFNMYGTSRIVCPIMDAKREQVYTGIYEFKTDGNEEVLFTIEEEMAVPIEEIAEKINSYERPVVFLGDGVPVFKGKLQELVTVPMIFASPDKCMQSAGSVAVLGMKYFNEGKTVPASQHAPEYLRLSQAERERNEALGEG